MGAFDQGFAFGASTAQRQAAHKQAYSDEEHETMLGDLNNSITNLQKRIAEVGPGHPDYSGLQRQLNQVVADRTALFHPNQPGGLERLGKLLWEKVHGPDTPAADAPRIAEVPIAGTQGSTLPPMPGGGPGGVSITTPNLPATSVPVDTRPSTPTNTPTPAELKSRIPQDIAAGAQHTNQFRDLHQALVEGGFSPEDAAKAARISAGLAPKPISYRPVAPHWQPYKLADGSTQEFNLNDPNLDLPDGAIPVPLASTIPHQSTAAQETYIRSQFPNGATPEQREWAIRRYQGLLHPDGSSSHESIQYDSDGNAHIVTLASSNKKGFGVNGPPPPNADGSSPQVSNGGAPAPTAARATGTATLSGQPVTVGQPTSTAAVPPPKTAGEARKRVSSVKGVAVPGVASAPAGDSRVADLHKNTPAQTAADKKVGDFTALSKQADLAEAAPNDAVKQRSLILALIRASAGRVNMQEYDSYVKRQGLANTLEQWANNAESGALPSDIFRKIIGVTRDYMAGAKAEQQEAYKNTNVKGKNGKGAAPAGTEDIDAIMKALKQGK
jgi:hypothetical protein